MNDTSIVARWLGIVLILVSYAGPVGLYGLLRYHDARRELSRLESSVESLEVDLREAEAVERQMDQFLEELDRLAEELAKLESVLPAELSETIPSQFVRKSQEHGVAIASLSTSELEDADFYRITRVTFELFGDPAAMADCLADLEQADPIKTILSLEPIDSASTDRGLRVEVELYSLFKERS